MWLIIPYIVKEPKKWTHMIFPNSETKRFVPTRHWDRRVSIKNLKRFSKILGLQKHTILTSEIKLHFCVILSVLSWLFFAKKPLPKKRSLYFASLPFSLRIDCAGILKLRNSDIELRKGETDIGRKNTRVRLVFRVHLNQPNGRTVSLQASSNPIECCKSHIHRYNKSERWIFFLVVLQETERRGVMSCWIALNTSSPVALALHNQMEIDDALYLMPNTHAIDLASQLCDWRQKLLRSDYPIN